MKLRLFTITTRELDGGDQLELVERQVKAEDRKDARKRFRRHEKKNKWGTAEIKSIYPTDVIL